MDNTFREDEKLYRAVYPPETASLFWKKDGGLSSAAFADPKGLSVDRGDFRPDAVVILDMSRRFTGRIVSVYVRNCRMTGACVRYCPSKTNIYHSEIHGSETERLLSKSQRRYLAQKAVVVF